MSDPASTVAITRNGTTLLLIDETMVRSAAGDADTTGATARCRHLLAGLETTDATHVSVICADGSYRASVPLHHVYRGGMLRVSSRDSASGGPFRFTVEGGDTLCWNVKDVGEIRFTVGAEPDDVPELPPH